MTMTNSEGVFARLVRQGDGTFTTSYGPFSLQTALQPIFGQDEAGELELAAFEGLVRASRLGDPFPTYQFFAMISQADMPAIDSLCRTLHILNAGLLHRRSARLFVNFHPGLFVTPGAVRQEVDRITAAADQAGMRPGQIVCEISRMTNEDMKATAHLAECLRDGGLKIAIDEYGAEDSDAERVNLLKPEFVKFEASWVLEFMRNSTGYALLQVMVEQFLERDIQPIFEGLEELSQVELCQKLGVPLMQGYVLARPEFAPTTFNRTYPEPFEPVRKSATSFGRPGIPDNRGTRRTASFGKRGV